MRKNLENNRSWCPIPWKGLTLRNNGEYRICIQSNTSAGNGKLYREEDQPFSIQNSKVQEVRNSSLLKEVRRFMLEGERHPSCERCNFEDDAGLTSARSTHRKFWKEEFSPEESALHTEGDGTIDPEKVPLGFLDIRLGNKCNLKCRMCGPSESTGWYREHFDTVGSGFHLYSGKIRLQEVNGRIQVQDRDPMNWVNEEVYWKNIEESSGELKMLHIVGGEPFLEERHFRFLQRLVSEGRSSSIILDYNSNITHIPSEAFGIWSRFKEVRIGASIDAVGSFNEYIRYPSKWGTVESNLDLLMGQKNLMVWITTTVQILNVFQIPDLYKWRIRKILSMGDTASRIPILKIHTLNSPKYFSIQALPGGEKARLQESYERFLDELPGFMIAAAVPEDVRLRWQEEITASLTSIVKFMYQRDLGAGIPDFWMKTNQMDSYRNQNFKSLYPELAIALKKEERVFNGNPADSRK